MASHLITTCILSAIGFFFYWLMSGRVRIQNCVLCIFVVITVADVVFLCAFVLDLPQRMAVACLNHR